MVATKRLTVAEFDAMDDAEAKGYELIDGELVGVELVSARHGNAELGIGTFLFLYAEETGNGEAFSSDTHFVISNEHGTVMKPDAAFVYAERLPQGDFWPRIIPIAPDLAVEVESPSNRPGEMMRRIAAYFDAGVRQVWVVRPITATLTVFTPGEPERVLGIDDTLDGGELLPGFSLRLRRIFRRREALDS